MNFKVSWWLKLDAPREMKENFKSLEWYPGNLAGMNEYRFYIYLGVLYRNNANLTLKALVGRSFEYEIPNI